MPTPYPFQSGATLLASQMNSLSQLPTVSITANSTAVATHAYSRVIANGSAITYTIPNSVFEAGQVIQFHNINSTNCTIAAGAGVTLNAAAGTTVAQYQSATIYATSASSFILFESDRTVSAGGLVYLTGATFTGATSFSLPDSTFTSTYRNYRMLISLSACTSDADFTVRMRASGTDNTSAVYDYALVGLGTVGASNSQGGGQTSWVFGETDSANVRNAYAFDILNPQIAQTTTLFGIYSFVPKSPTDVIGRNGYWQHNSTTQFDSLSFISSVASSITGVYRVYGYADS